MTDKEDIVKLCTEAFNSGVKSGMGLLLDRIEREVIGEMEKYTVVGILKTPLNTEVWLTVGARNELRQQQREALDKIRREIE